MTLFLPRDGSGFVSLNDGAVALRRILIPIDHDPAPQAALEKALLLARGLGCAAGALRLVHVGPPRSAPVIDPPGRPGWSYEVIVRQGDVLEEILRTEHDWQPELMVLATHGHLDFLDALRGSTTERLLRRARCPVLAVPAFNEFH